MTKLFIILCDINGFIKFEVYYNSFDQIRECPKIFVHLYNLNPVTSNKLGHISLEIFFHDFLKIQAFTLNHDFGYKRIGRLFIANTGSGKTHVIGEFSLRIESLQARSTALRAIELFLIFEIFETNSWYPKTVA